MTWVGWILIGICIYLLVLVGRALVDFGRWAFDEWVVQPRQMREWKDRAAGRKAPPKAQSAESKPSPPQTPVVILHGEKDLAAVGRPRRPPHGTNPQ